MRLFVFGRKAPFRALVSILPALMLRVSAREHNCEK